MIKYIGIISLVIYSILVVILSINLHKKNIFIKNTAVVLFSLLGVTFLIYNQGIINGCLEFFIRFIYFPTFNSYIMMIFLTICILVYSMLSDKISNKFKITNYIFSSLLFVTYIIFMSLNVNMSSYNSLYSNPSLFWLRASTRCFVIWIFVLLIIKYYNEFGRKR